MNERCILCLDDELPILNALKRLFRSTSIKVVTVDNATDALSQLALGKFPLVITDYRMPDTTGTQFVSQAKKVSPDTVFVIMSGFAEDRSISEAIAKGEVHKYVNKPWNDQDLINLVEECIQIYHRRGT